MSVQKQDVQELKSAVVSINRRGTITVLVPTALILFLIMQIYGAGQTIQKVYDRLSDIERRITAIETKGK